MLSTDCMCLDRRGRSLYNGEDRMPDAFGTPIHHRIGDKHMGKYYEDAFEAALDMTTSLLEGGANVTLDAAGAHAVMEFFNSLYVELSLLTDEYDEDDEEEDEEEAEAEEEPEE